MKRFLLPILLLLGFFMCLSTGLAQDKPPTLEEKVDKLLEQTANQTIATDTLWVIIAAILVFFMNLGFGCVESGFCRQKNCVNILSKNFIVFAAASIAFWLVGWGLMFGDGNSLFGTQGLFMLGGADNSPSTDSYSGVYSAIAWAGVPLWAKFFFQLVFAGTAATIVSGVVAERIKYQTFIVFIFLMTIFIYPIVGHWIWGGGFLGDMGFFDFAGSTVVHSVGGWAGLMGVIFLGARIGKYNKDGKPNAIPGHNLTVATIGCFVLWFGWFGFNPGSTMSASDTGLLARICITTNIAAAAGILSATVFSWLLMGKPDLGMTLNGCLAGLVAITAPCACVTVASSFLIGLIAGALVVVAVLWIDRARIDDPVGALSVHLVNGIWGTLCVGLFGLTTIDGSKTGLGNNGLFAGGGFSQLWPQIAGILVVGVYVLAVGAVVWCVLKATMGLRVTREEEVEGLDITEHGNEAYPGFVVAAEMDSPQHAYEPKAAMVPPKDAKRYEVVINGIGNDKLADLWSGICQPNGDGASSELKAVYPYLTTVQGNSFRFRGGEPESVRDNLQKLLQAKAGGGVEAQLAS